MMYGEKEADLFYIILKGEVSVQTPNPTILQWSLKRRDFKDLLEWREIDF